MIDEEDLVEMYAAFEEGLHWDGAWTATLLIEYRELSAEVKRLREESKKKGNVLSTLDEMIRNEESHVEMMKALEQGLDLPETWKEMIE